MPGSHSQAAAHRTIDRQWWVQRWRERRAVTHLGSRARPMPYRRRPLRTRKRTSRALWPRRRHPAGPYERRDAGAGFAFCHGTPPVCRPCFRPLAHSGHHPGQVDDLRRQQGTCERRQGPATPILHVSVAPAPASTVDARTLARCGSHFKYRRPEGAQRIAASARFLPRNAHQTLPNDVQGDHPDNLDRIG
ncbi:hypothetical protein GGQ64_001837 [Rhizobium azooxidifex]|uniref:Uncharacterized protein n=1 Tax=Mycoplana azooxidifex TaxID=1636188 RepID=A0A7W6DBE9_9HYPH|nr:hypothetical protein [Mycoplana azooxidifex]